MRRHLNLIIFHVYLFADIFPVFSSSSSYNSIIRTEAAPSTTSQYDASDDDGIIVDGFDTSTNGLSISRRSWW